MSVCVHMRMRTRTRRECVHVHVCVCVCVCVCETLSRDCDVTIPRGEESIDRQALPRGESLQNPNAPRNRSTFAMKCERIGSAMRARCDVRSALGPYKKGVLVLHASLAGRPLGPNANSTAPYDGTIFEWLQTLISSHCCAASQAAALARMRRPWSIVWRRGLRCASVAEHVRRSIPRRRRWVHTACGSLCRRTSRRLCTPTDPLSRQSPWCARASRRAAFGRHRDAGAHARRVSTSAHAPPSVGSVSNAGGSWGRRIAWRRLPSLTAGC